MYNLMIMAGDDFWENNATFDWPLDRFLSHTETSIKERLKHLDLEAKEILKSLPCLFMYEFRYSDRYGVKAPSMGARVGRLVDIELTDDGVTVHFDFDDASYRIDSQRLSECWNELGIRTKAGENSNSHWAVKGADLGGVLISGNLVPPPPSVDDQAARASQATPVARSAEVSTAAQTWKRPSELGAAPAAQADEPKPASAPEVAQALRAIAQTVPHPTGARPKVFVVHGRDDSVKNDVARWLGNLGMKEVVLHEHANRGRDILTKFRDLAKDTSFAVVIATPDDVGGLKDGPQSARARQNVILELGFFIGVLGPGRVAVLRCDPELEIPSDYRNILMIDYDGRGAWKVDLARELRDAEIPFDPSALL